MILLQSQVWLRGGNIAKNREKSRVNAKKIK